MCCAGDDNEHRLWVGSLEGNTTLEYALVACGASNWSFLNPVTDTVSDEVPAPILKMLMRRRYLVRKAEDATIVGILISTVAIEGWKSLLEQIKALANAVEKKTYTVFLGKPAPEKLANFPEVRACFMEGGPSSSVQRRVPAANCSTAGRVWLQVEVWVQISDPAGFVWDSKPYLAPVVAPAEAAEAWQPLVSDITECASVSMDVPSWLRDM